MTIRSRRGTLAALAVEHDEHEHLRIVVEATPIAIIVVDEHSRIRLANGHAQLLFGYTADELFGQDASGLVPERFRTAYTVLRDEYLLAPSSRPMGKNLFAIRKDGSEFPVEIGLNPVRTRHGHYTLAAIVDITERKEAEERKHSQEQMALVIDGAAGAMIVTDSSGRITLINSEVERIFGYLRQELLDRSVDMLLPARFRDEHSRLRNAHVTAATSVIAGREVFGLHKDGREIPLEIFLRQFSKSKGYLVLASILDISDRKHADELRLATALHRAEISTLHAEIQNVEVALEISEEREYHQAKRLESLWRIINTPLLRGDQLVLAMLREAATAMRPGQAYTGVLGHVDGSTYVIDAVAGADHDDPATIEHALRVGMRTELSELLFARDLAAGRTQSWLDCQAIPDLPSRAVEAGLRSQIATHFTANEVVYVLTLASLEASTIPFGSEDYAYIEVLGSFFSHHLEQERLEDSLRSAESRSRQHADRLDAVWQIANNPALRGQALILAMLRQAAAAIRVGQNFNGLLGRIDGNEVIVIGVGADPGTEEPIGRVQIGQRTALDQTIVPSVNGTQVWRDLTTQTRAGAGLSFLGWQAAISTQFDVGNSRYWLTFGSAVTTSTPFDADDVAYMNLLASSFAKQMQLGEMETSLREAELRSRQDAARLEAVWEIANDRTLGRHELVLAMLRKSAAMMRPGQRFFALLGRIEGAEVVLLGAAHAFGADGAEMITLVGSRMPIDQAIVASANRTQCWDDAATASNPPAGMAALGCRSAISTRFKAGHSWYSLTFGSADPMKTPFDVEDFAYLDVLAASFASHFQVGELEDSLRAEEDQSRRHARRLEAMWSIVNDTNLRDEQLFLAMLNEAASSIRPEMLYQAILWRIDGTDMIVVAASSFERRIVGFWAQVGMTIPLLGTATANVLAAGGGTRLWDDVQTADDASFLAKRNGTRSLIITTFSAGATQWGLSFASTEATRKPLGPQDRAFVEVLASFFSNHVQQRWQFERIQYQQSHDVLTGVFSRSQFRSQARASARTNAHYAIIYVDIDAFREINDSFGHLIGDALLVEVGNALRQRAQPDEIVGRVGGNVFGIYVPNPKSKDAVLRRARDFAAAFAGSFSIGDRFGKEFISRTARLGMAVAPDDGVSVDAIIRYADAALVKAKERGPGSIVFYEAGMVGDSRRRATLQNELADAVAGNQFTLYYQPHVEISTGAVAGCEALIRWQHPTRGLLMPGQFIPFAEQTGIITTIDNWVMQTALASANDLSTGRKDFRLFFNLSGRQAGNTKLIRAFVDAARNGVKLGNVGVEITESDAMRDIEATRGVCRALRRLNVRIAIDDFGTGYSSLSSLKRLPVDIIKIDRSFISGIPNDPDDVTIAETIIAIADHFGFAALAEGAERQEQIDWLEKHACRYVQGFALCGPLPLQEFKAWLSARAI